MLTQILASLLVRGFVARAERLLVWRPEKWFDRLPVRLVGAHDALPEYWGKPRS
jgi:hypothetical protein